LNTQDKSVSQFRKAKPDNVVGYVSNNANLIFPVFVQGKDAVEKVNLKFTDGMLRLDRKQDKAKIDALDSILNDQYEKDDKGAFTKDKNGKRVLRAGGKNYGITKVDDFELSLLKNPVRVEVGLDEVLEFTVQDIVTMYEHYLKKGGKK